MKKIILSEIELFENNENFEVRPLKYGNRLFNYLSNKPKKRALERFLTEEVDIIVCCRATAIILNSMDCKNLKMIQLTSTGYDGVPVEEFKKKGIMVCNSSGVYSVSIAETVIYAILSVCKRIRKNPKNYRPKLFRKYSEITELAQKRVLIMGTGNIGTEIANRLKAFECKIEGYDAYCKLKEPYEGIINTKKQLLEKLSEYDYIISTIPAVEETKDFCDQNFFSKMKSTAWFMNVGREATVDEKALYLALKNKLIGGAIFDQVELIPYALFNKFRRLKNTLVLPGIVTSSKESLNKIKVRIEGNILSFINGNKQDNL
ncbi:MAG: hypothetical protein E7348_01695 [Clostridiales bacterium]|nr:hypothetical protein [Clostridiales bacterium]